MLAEGGGQIGGVIASWKWQEKHSFDQSHESDSQDPPDQQLPSPIRPVSLRINRWGNHRQHYRKSAGFRSELQQVGWGYAGGQVSAVTKPRSGGSRNWLLQRGGGGEGALGIGI